MASMRIIRPTSDGFDGAHLVVTPNGDSTVNVRKNNQTTVINMPNRPVSEFTSGDVSTSSPPDAPTIITSTGE
jgi:hypothetical protein